MSEQPSNDPLGQFLGDLSAIREKRNVSLEELRNATKVYPNVIAQFEQDGLKDHPLFNSLYVRAFIRSYAGAVGIPPEEVLDAYDEALSGGYRRQLAIEHLDLPVEEIEALRLMQEQKKKVEPVFTADKFEFDKPAARTSDKSKPKSKTKPAEKKPEKSAIDEAIDSKATVTFVPKSSSRRRKQSEAGILDNIQEMLKPILGSGKQSALVQWGLVAVGIVIGIVALMQLLSFQSSSAQEDDMPPLAAEQSEQPEETNAGNVIAPDSLAPLPAEELQVETPVVPVVLGDSIPVYVVAADGKLDPFRLKLDRDLRRPYWLDEGDSMLVFFKERATFEVNLANMDILIEGRSYPIYRTDSLATVVIDRDSVQTFLQRP